MRLSEFEHKTLTSPKKLWKQAVELSKQMEKNGDAKLITNENIKEYIKKYIWGKRLDDSL